MKKIAVLTSGNSRGSNFQAIANHLKSKNLPIEISFLVTNKKNPPVKNKAEKYNINSIFISTKKMSDFEKILTGHIIKNNLDLIVLAGFMKKISEDFIKKIKIPIINIHPALLPKYGGKGMYGMNVHKAVFENKDKLSGATVHYVNQHYDEGQIISQESIKINDCKSPQEIADKVLSIEHKLYPQTIEKILS